MEILSTLISESGFVGLNWPHLLMMAVGCGLVLLSLKRKHQPLLLIPLGFGIFLIRNVFRSRFFSNVLLSSLLLGFLATATAPFPATSFGSGLFLFRGRGCFFSHRFFRNGFIRYYFFFRGFICFWRFNRLFHNFASSFSATAAWSVL